MVQFYSHKKLTWIDLTSPTREEVRSIMETYKIDPLLAEELLSPTLKPRVDLFPEYIYIILHFPAFKGSHGKQEQEIDFVIGKNFIITTRYDQLNPLQEFSKVFEVNSILDRNVMGDHAGFIFFYMIKKLYGSLQQELDYLGGKLKEIEAKIFHGKEKEMVFELSKVSRELLRFKQALGIHREILDSFEVAGKEFFGEKFAYYLKAIIGSYTRVHHSILSQGDTLNEMRETNNSLLSTKENETMKILAVISFVTFPLTLIAAIFSMDTIHTPIVGLKGDFWIVLGIMLLLVLAIFSFFKYKEWL